MNTTQRVKKLFCQRRVIWGMVRKNLQDRYTSSSLGIFWAVLNPLLIMLVITFVFSQVLKTEARHYPLLVLSALLPWNFFIGSITESANSLKHHIDMIKQFMMLREAVPLSIVTANLVNFLFGFAITLPVFVFFDPAVLRSIPLLPVIIVLHFFFTLGISLMFAIISSHFKDFTHLLSIIIMFLFWITPVFYSAEMIPEQYRWVLIANPGSCFVILYRELLYGASGGRPQLWLYALGFSLASIVIGYALFIRKEAEAIKYL